MAVLRVRIEANSAAADPAGIADGSDVRRGVPPLLCRSGIRGGNRVRGNAESCRLASVRFLGAMRLLVLPTRFGSWTSGREVANDSDTVMRVWTGDGLETTYETAHLHPKYLAARSAEARYDVVFEYTVFLVSNFLRRVDGAFFGQFRDMPARLRAPCDRAPAPLASFRRQTPLCGTCATGKEPEARAQPGRLLGSGR